MPVREGEREPVSSPAIAPFRLKGERKWTSNR